MTAATPAQPRPGWWAGLFAINMIVIAFAHIFDFIEQPVPFILFLLNMVLLVPWIRAARRQMEARGENSPALRKYNNRVTVVVFVYMITIVGAAELKDAVPAGSPLLWVLAITPLLPLLGMIWSMTRYYREENDEYLRHRASTSALVGLVLVLVIGTSWGFLEMFGLVPHMWNWWVFPVWAIGMGIGRCVPGRSYGAESGE